MACAIHTKITKLYWDWDSLVGPLWRERGNGFENTSGTVGPRQTVLNLTG